MKIKVDFSDLFACVEEMGATLVNEPLLAPPKPSEGLERPEWVPTRKEIDISEVESIQGLLTHIDEQGVSQQVLLYIQDHGWNIEAAIHNIAVNVKVTVAKS